MAVKNVVFKETMPFLKEQWGSELTERILKKAEEYYKQLLEENSNESKAVRTHTAGKIYPCISLYRAMTDNGIEKKTAEEFLDRTHSIRAEKDAVSIQRLMKIPGLYRLMPRIFRLVTLNQFGEAAGFKARFYPEGSKRVKFDMTKCLYCDVCRKNGVPELTKCFCHTDDVVDGHMHPKLIWNRTKIMGDGGDVCDFDLYIEEKKR